MSNKTRIICTSLLLLLAFSGGAQQSRSLSLEEAISLSLQHSNELKLSQAKNEESKAALQAAREQRLPNASISGSYLRLNQPNVDLKIKTGQSQGSGEGQSSGTAVAVDQAAYVLANVSVPVFSGFRISNNIEAAEYLRKASLLDAEKDRDEIIATTIAAYSNLYKAKAALDLVRENLKQSQQRVKDFSNLEQNGIIARNDLLKVQLQQSNIELGLLDAENNWKLTSISMNLMLGLPEQTILLPDSLAFQLSAQNRNYEDWESIALQQRSDAMALNYRKKAADAGVRAAKGEYYPSISVTGGYIAAHVPNLLTITNAINAGVGVSYSPSSLWKAGSKVAQAKAKQQEMSLSREILSDAVRLQVAQAYQSYLSGEKKIEVYAKAVEQANENYRIVRNKYENSLATTTDLLEADVAQLQAKINYVFSQADILVAYKKLQQAAGVLSKSAE